MSKLLFLWTFLFMIIGMYVKLIKIDLLIYYYINIWLSLFLLSNYKSSKTIRIQK